MKAAGIVAFAFGVPETMRSNQQIAQIASEKAWQISAPVYTQLDVFIGPGIETEHTDEEPGHPPPTLRIARGAAQWAADRGLKELWIVAAKPHLWRALRDVKAAIRETGNNIEVRACPEIEQYPLDSWFCSESTQSRVRSRATWERRERMLRFIPFFIYKLIAK